jgi:hypothetical protein
MVVGPVAFGPVVRWPIMVRAHSGAGGQEVRTERRGIGVPLALTRARPLT